MQKGKKFFFRAFYVLYPIALHYVLSMVVSRAALAVISLTAEDPMEVYYQWTVVITGITAAVVMVPAALLYQKDAQKRYRLQRIPSEYGQNLSLPDMVLLLLLGGAAALTGNLLMGIVQNYIQPDTYMEMIGTITEGKGIWTLVLFLGFLAPIGEEMIFRWLVYLRLRDILGFPAACLLSGVIFGIYHGNLFQGIYAGVLGILFACVMEWTGNVWASAFLHIGANSVTLLYAEYAPKLLDAHMEFVVGAINLLLFGILILGFGREGKSSLAFIKKYLPHADVGIADK
ncbi:MAG: CPBP family intramembrane metalloprotease, partial [Blautia sp.]|nr:CPBP family intramembrane metalloprotease [Blautia sp.]